VTTTTDPIAQLQAHIQENAEKLAAARSLRSDEDLLAENEKRLLSDLEQAVKAQNVTAVNVYADKVPAILGTTETALLEKLETHATAATDVLVAARAHVATVNDVTAQAQHLAQGAREGRIVDSRFGLNIDGRRIAFEADAVAGAVARSLEPVFRRLGQGVIADQMQNLARSTPTLSSPEDAKNTKEVE